MVIQKKTWNWY